MVKNIRATSFIFILYSRFKRFRVRETKNHRFDRAEIHREQSYNYDVVPILDDLTDDDFPEEVLELEDRMTRITYRMLEVSFDYNLNL